MFDDWEPLAVVVLIVALAVGGIWWLVSYSQDREAEWRAFRDAHHCRIVGHTAGQTAITTNGHTAFISAQDSWLCDDGITYTRERE